MNARYLAFSGISCLWVTYDVQNKHPFHEISVRQLHESKNVAAFRRRTVFPSAGYYEACPESGDTKVLNMYNIFKLQK
jgi:hypothetical protein